MEVGLGGGAVADPARSDAGVALDGRGHAPAYRLNELRGQVARDAEEAPFAVGIHDRQLAALERIAFVGHQLAHHGDQRDVARQQDALLAVGRKAHVALFQRHGVGRADGLFAQALHVERDLLLALRGQHAPIEDSRLQHGAHAGAQQIVADLRRPRTDGAAFVVDHPDQAVGQPAGIDRGNINGGFGHVAGRRQVQVGKVGLATRTPRGFRDVQLQWPILAHVLSPRLIVSCVYSCQGHGARR
ncbi:hypothetical protein FQZ97_922840 [compost metagenome]